MINAEIAILFNEIGDFLELKGENPFRVRAYRRAAQALEGLAEDVASVSARGDLLSIGGIGKDLATKIDEFLARRSIEYLEELRREIPAGVIELVGVHGVGPKTAKLLYERAGVDSVEKLEALAREHKLAGIPGIQAKTEENILRGIAVWRSGRERTPIGTALGLAETIVQQLQEQAPIDRIALAGSVRRMKETVKDVDILVTSHEPARVMDRFVTLPMVADVIARGDTKSSVRLRRNLQVDLRVVEPNSFGAALQYFTGSKQHNIRLRELAQRRGLKINEYGVFRDDGTRVGGAAEEEVYAAVDLPWIAPELREDAGEIEAAALGRLPQLITLDDMQGDLQLHSTWSDGALSVADLADAVRSRGYRYMAVTDHSQSTSIAGGMDPARLIAMMAEVRSLRPRFPDFHILVGCEVDIRADGSLDYEDELLRQLDLVQISVHSRFKMTREEMTARIVRGVRHPLVHIMGHPTGRVIGQRAPYEVDLEAVFDAAREAGTAMEINASPARLDLQDVAARRAKDLGLPITISTDAHVATELPYMRFGVAVARRAWITASDVLNARPLPRLLKWLEQKRRT
jgi:DNA polymerase (family X)